VAFHKKAGLRVMDMVKSNWVYRKLRNFRAGIEFASACACERAAMNEISASRTAICIGSLVAPSKTRPLFTVRMTMPRFMNARMTSVTSA
jgi:hypothetical protein